MNKNRGPDGRFIKGNKVGKGRPPKEQSITHYMREYLDSHYGDKKNNPPRIKLFIAKTFNLAMRGDSTAIRLIWNYLDGMPKQQVEHSGHILQTFEDLMKYANDNPSNSTVGKDKISE